MAYTTTLTFSSSISLGASLPSSFTIPVEAVTFGFTNSVTVGSQSGGAGVGKLAFNNFTVTRYLDAYSPVFLTICGSGTHYSTATLTVTAQGGTSPIALYTLGTVFCEAVSVTGNQHGGPLPTEEVTFVFGSMKIQFTDPKTGVTTTGTWSQLSNSPG